MNDLDFINAQIIQSKAKLFDLEVARKEEETKLFALHGALETLQMQQQRMKTQNVTSE